MQNQSMLNTNPRRMLEMKKASVAQYATGALPCFADCFPDGLKARKTPIEEDRSIVPKVALEMWRCAFMSGRRATNEPYAKPLVMKVSVTASLARLSSIAT